MNYYVPQDPSFIKKQKEKARELRKSSWWLQKLVEGVCYYCEQKFNKEDLTMDHKVAIARGGVSSKNNIVPCCKECNSKKQSQNSIDFVSIE